ncbi:MAG: hypothetical protein AB7J35_14730 [Dehalococcoidia bacterium]
MGYSQFRRRGRMLRHLLKKMDEEMNLKDELMELERGFWEASSDPAYYEAHMSGDGIAVFADLILDKADAVKSARENRAGDWTNIRLVSVNLLSLSPDIAALVYTGHAERAGIPYAANVISTYRRGDSGWEMVLHQQSVNAH